MGQRKQYTKEFKFETVGLVSEPGQTFTGVSIYLGISAPVPPLLVKAVVRQSTAVFPGQRKARLIAVQAAIERVYGASWTHHS